MGHDDGKEAGVDMKLRLSLVEVGFVMIFGAMASVTFGMWMHSVAAGFFLGAMILLILVVLRDEEGE